MIVRTRPYALSPRNIRGIEAIGEAAERNEEDDQEVVGGAASLGHFGNESAWGSGCWKYSSNRGCASVRSSTENEISESRFPLYVASLIGFR